MKTNQINIKTNQETTKDNQETIKHNQRTIKHNQETIKTKVAGIYPATFVGIGMYAKGDRQATYSDAESPGECINNCYACYRASRGVEPG